MKFENGDHPNSGYVGFLGLKLPAVVNHGPGKLCPVLKHCHIVETKHFEDY
jgi:hypothetical protein